MAIALPDIITHMYRHGCRGADLVVIEANSVDDRGTWRINPIQFGVTL
jgi:hypothetical protein